MLRSFQELKGGLGEWTLRPETDEEIAQLQAICPPGGVPDGVLTGYEWTAGRLTLFARHDPAYKPPAPPTQAPSDLVEAVPSRETLLEKPIADLITKAAELAVTHKVGETKAALVAKIIPAWIARNAELAKKKTPVTPPPA